MGTAILRGKLTRRYRLKTTRQSYWLAQIRLSYDADNQGFPGLGAVIQLGDGGKPGDGLGSNFSGTGDQRTPVYRSGRNLRSQVHNRGEATRHSLAVVTPRQNRRILKSVFAMWRCAMPQRAPDSRKKRPAQPIAGRAASICFGSGPGTATSNTQG
jgi:hypothetical protein